MQKGTVRNSILLLLTAVIWGTAFVAQSVGMDYIGPFTFNAARFFVGGTVLLPLILYFKKINPVTEKTESEKRYDRKMLVIGGLLCGLAILGGSTFQQLGIQYTSVGKAGFITTLYIIIVPIIGLLFHQKVAGKIWVAAVMAMVGLYLLCVNESFSVNKGDTLVLIGSLLFSIHILVIDYYSPRVDGVKLSCIQFYVSGLISSVAAFLTETPSLGAIMDGIMPILYAGVMSCGVAYTLQIIGQKNMNPTVASLILSLESVISVLAGWVILGQELALKEIIGCVIVFAAVILVQLPDKKEA